MKETGCQVMEIEAQRSDSYHDLAQRASNALIVHLVPGQTVAVYKYSGVEIAENYLTVKGQKKKWTLGNYLLACKKSPSQMKFGIGFPSHHEHSSHEDDEVNNVNV